MFNKCRHIKSPNDLATKADMVDTHLESYGRTLHEFKCKKCGKVVASKMDGY